MNEEIPTPLTDAMCQDDFLANYYSDPTEFYVPAEFARGLERELASCRQSQEMQSSKYNELFAAITAHHGQKADDRCIEDDDRLYAAAGLPPCDRRVGSKEDMLKNCARFIERRCEVGWWKSYIELESELAALKRGEFICAKCGLRTDGEREKGEF